MSRTERRTAPRFIVRLEATFRNRDQEVQAVTSTIGRHGLFVITPHLKMQGELVQMTVRLPTGAASPPVMLRMMCVVSWTLTPAEAEQRSREPGLGLKFFMIAAADKSRWDQFIEGLERGENAGSAPLPPEPLREGPMKFLLRARSVDQLRQFGGQELVDGRMFLRTPLVRGMHEAIELVLIHPETEEEFALPGQIVTVVPTGPVAQRGMGIELKHGGLEVRRRFERFIMGDARATAQVARRVG